MSTASGERYGEDYFKSVFGCDGLKRYGMHWWSVRFYAGVCDRWLRRIGGRRMLDVGCGHGFILSFLHERYETFGIDLSAYAIEQCARFTPRSTCAVADVEQELPAHLTAGTFDLVNARYVFEHLADPPAAMARLVRLLRPGGVLFFSVPNTESFGRRWKGADWYAHKDPTHVSLLAPERWLEIARGCGLDVVKEFSDGYWDLPYVKWVPWWLQFPVFIGPSALACLTTWEILPARFGENVMVIAQKPDKPGGGDHT
ncbi:MAG: Ubiquinone biosynthesis O-methyltransferase [Phycisphaerae bacterium]|nr:Ubiquinone biosynthesis O-methyltransferase [Phycisphaerae bacterium]